MKNQKHIAKLAGFTLIELMIVIAIIGILAAVAIPQYQTYAIRTEATQALNAARPFILAIDELAATTDGNMADVDDFADLPGYDSTTTTAETCSGSVATVDIENGIITATFNNDAEYTCGGVTVSDIPSALFSKTVTFTPSANSFGVVTWAIGGTLDAKYRPRL